MTLVETMRRDSLAPEGKMRLRCLGRPADGSHVSVPRPPADEVEMPTSDVGVYLLSCDHVDGHPIPETHYRWITYLEREAAGERIRQRIAELKRAKRARPEEREQ